MTERSQGGGKDELSRTLLDLRKAAGLGGHAAAQLAGFSQSKVSRLERGINIPTVEDVEALARAYKATAAVRRRLVELARDIQAEHRPVVMARGKGRPDEFQARLARIEAASRRIRAFTPLGVPGLLQTEQYIRHLIANRDLPAERADAFVEARLRRRAILGSPGHDVELITTAGALGWRLGSREDMAQQAEHIAAAIGTPGLRVGIVPWGARASRIVLHAWDIYDERAVSYGTVDATAILTEPRDVARYIELHAMVSGIAVFGDEARDVLARIAEEYRRSRGAC